MYFVRFGWDLVSGQLWGKNNIEWVWDSYGYFLFTTTTRTTAQATGGACIRGSCGRESKGPHHHQQDLMIFSLQRKPPLLVMIIERFMSATTDARKLRNTPFNSYWSPLFGNTVYDENFDLKPESLKCHLTSPASKCWFLGIFPFLSDYFSCFVIISHIYKSKSLKILYESNGVFLNVLASVCAF